MIGRLKATRQLAVIGVVVSLLAAAGAAHADDAKPAPTPEQRMQARFPQKVRVGDLIGLPLLDEAHSTLGLVREVVRDKDGKVELVIGYGGIFSYLGWDTRPVAVPIEVVGSAGANLLRSTCRAANTRRRRPGGRTTLPCCRRTPPFGSRCAAATERSRLCEADNFLVFADL